MNITGPNPITKMTALNPPSAVQGQSLPKEAPQPPPGVEYTDAHGTPQHHLTHIQTTLLIVYVTVLIFWIIRTICGAFNIRIFNYLPAAGYVQHFGNKTSGDASSSSSSTSDNLKNHQYQRLRENDDPAILKEGDKNYLQQSGTTPNGEILDGNSNGSSRQSGSTTVINLGQTGISKNLNERHFDSTLKHVSLDEEKAGGASSVRNSPPMGDGKSVNNSGADGSQMKSSGGSASAGAGPPSVSFDKFLNSFVLFGIIMIFFCFCDYVKVFPQGHRTYSRDLFYFLVFLFFLVASAFTLKDNPDKILNREQTEEWKGWMQVMFVWYHYFRAAEWYNWIRVYIACYVWMTGFGNFSFFWIRKDFSMLRMAKMLFRLNFLVIFVAMVTNNEYMLYYICAMHTYWFLTVYVFMRVLNSWNTNPYKMAVKFVAYAVCNAIIFDVPGFSEEIFRPLKCVLGFHGYDDKYDIMHEWSFRAGLDHWACFVGMLCAYNYPHFEALMAYLDSKSISQSENTKKMGIRAGLGIGALVIGASWHQTVFQQEKYAYNAQHSYTSAIPILVFIVLRNIHPVLRSKHIGMFSWLGKITLETYLSQLHIYLLANARTLLMYLPDYPLLNFALATIVYLLMSNLLFSITNDASSFLIPRDHKKLVLNVLCVVALFVFASVLAYGVFL